MILVMDSPRLGEEPQEAPTVPGSPRRGRGRQRGLRWSRGPCRLCAALGPGRHCARGNEGRSRERGDCARNGGEEAGARTGEACDVEKLGWGCAVEHDARRGFDKGCLDLLGSGREAPCQFWATS